MKTPFRNRYIHCWTNLRETKVLPTNAISRSNRIPISRVSLACVIRYAAPVVARGCTLDLQQSTSLPASPGLQVVTKSPIAELQERQCIDPKKISINLYKQNISTCKEVTQEPNNSTSIKDLLNIIKVAKHTFQ